ncbi:MAG: hypothetical protein LBN38_06290 [Verrucomicrobiota bacterium]|nr:hypothetical protein [Verrucomicrobiota bacterium]
MKRMGMMGCAVVMVLALAACHNDKNDDADDPGHHPAVSVTGNWDTTVDGTHLGVMVLDVGDNGILKGTMLTDAGATAQLSGVMDGYVAEFSMIFERESYWGTLTFHSGGNAAAGVLLDNKGGTQNLRLTPSPITGNKTP